VFRTVNDQPTLWDAILPSELLVLPVELGRVDALLDDPVFFSPFAPYFDARIGRPSIPMETYLRLMFLKFRYRLGYESLCREVADSISWQRFCRIPFGTRVPHPTTLMKITIRCGDDAVAGLNEALLARAAAEKLLRTDKVRADTTVVEAAVAYPTDSGLLAKAIGTIARTVVRIKAAGGATRTRARDRRRSAGRRARSIAAKLKLRGQQQRDQAQAAVRRITAELAGIAEAAMAEAATVLRNAQTRAAHRLGRTQGPATPGDQRSRHPDGTHPTCGGPDPQPAGRGDARVGAPAGQPPRCRRPPDPQRTPGQAGRVRLQGADRRQRRRGHPRPHHRDRKPR
jgi:transposase, IS5 family